MSNRYLVTAKTARQGEVISLKGASLNYREVQEALRTLKRNYSQVNCGWILTHWVENRSGKVLIDFEMEAVRDSTIFPELGEEGLDERFFVSLVADDRHYSRKHV